ncbi:MAG: glycosyltransferase [Thermoanaerobaculia bacterium]
MTPAVSVVIPTFNRRDVLDEVLSALDRQLGAPDFEVIVVDDGSSDGTAEALDRRAQIRPLRLLQQRNRGPAAARNLGVTAASGGLVAFLGDDTVPAPDWLARHVAAHAERSAPRLAVVGFTDWHPRTRQTPFLRYLNARGLQFGYALISDPEQVPFNFFYTSNLSLRRTTLLEEPFDESFPFPAWEDTEAAYRLTRRGLRLVYEPRAIAQHDHPTDFARFSRRQEQAGWSAAIFFRKHPELREFLGIGPSGPERLPSRARQFAREGLVRTLQFFPVSLPGLWEKTLRFHYLRGLHQGWNEGPADMERVES